MQKAFTSVRGIYGVSKQATQNYLDIYGKYIHKDTRIDSIYNFVDIQQFKPSDESRQKTRKRFSITDDVFLLGFTGRLDKQKRPDLLISVFNKLNKRIPNTQLVLVGEGPLKMECREKVDQLGLSQSVHFWGFQNNIEQIIPAFDLFLLLSIREGFGISTIEAMACGVPVVVSDAPGSHEVLMDCESGILVHPDDEDKIVDSLANLITDSDKRNYMAMAGPGEAKEKYSKLIWEKSIKDFYHSLL